MVSAIFLLPWALGAALGAPSALALALPDMKPAPISCPLENGNLLDVTLFVPDEEACKELCSFQKNCVFYGFYPEGNHKERMPRVGDNETVPANRKAPESVGNQPAQCFLYDACSRDVLPATRDCPLTLENTVKITPFVKNEEACKQNCSWNSKCNYFKYLTNDGPSSQVPLCYHLKKCSPRMIRQTECPLERNNYIDHYLFTQSPEECEMRCKSKVECRFYHWYPVDYSPAPLYCYLYRSCLGGSDEEKVGIILSGRHPGHYFLGRSSGTTTDEVHSSRVCRRDSPVVGQDIDGLVVDRAGSMAAYLKEDDKDGDVLLCGGQAGNGQILADCLAYTPKTMLWRSHSQLMEPREEAASVSVPEYGLVYILGGQINHKPTATSEVYQGGSWGPWVSLPEARSKFCAVVLNGSIVVLGGEVEDTPTSNEVKMYNTDTKEWEPLPEMLVKRKDHACTTVSLGDVEGILVSGGVNEDEKLLDSVEFFSLEHLEWEELDSMKLPRTEHGMEVIGGLPTVVGGVTANEFLSSIEILESTPNSSSLMGLEWRVAAHSMATPRYDFGIAAVPVSEVVTISSRKSAEHEETICGDEDSDLQDPNMDEENKQSDESAGLINDDD